MSEQLTSYLEVVRAARNREYFEDFKTRGRLASDIRSGYQAGMAAFSDLSEQGFVKLQSGLMVLDTLSPAHWLTAGLLNGDKESWEICDAYPLKSRKFKPDLLNLEAIGREGEDFVVSWLTLNLEPAHHPRIIHKSLTDDSAGYDISSPSRKLQGQILLEVKTSTRVGPDFNFHLSRNEWHTALSHPNWYLLLVSKVQGSYRFFGYLDSQSLVSYFPSDRHKAFRWTSASGQLGSDDVFAGVPGF